MITKSTPWSITWKEDISRVITFSGEWTLGPKFYLLLPATPCWDGSNTPIKHDELKTLLTRFENEAKQRGWVIVIEQEASK